jgi:CheY-like chemotaxis protein
MDPVILDIGYQAPQKKKILVVDDEISIQSLMQDAFMDQYNVLAAHDGREGLTMAERTQPDVIIMDVMMPDLNGYEAVKMLRANPLTQKIPVVIATAKGFDSTTIEMLKSEVNVVGYLAKPFRIADVRAIVAKAVGQ